MAKPPLPGNGGNGGAGRNRGTDALSQLTFKSFTATPDHVQAFGASTLHWVVTTKNNVMPLGVQLSIDNFATTVGLTGFREVHPTGTGSYMLQARAYQASVLLGTASVFVDLSACTAVGLGSAALTHDLIVGFLRAAIAVIDADPSNGGRFVPKADPVVTPAPGTISFQMTVIHNRNGVPFPIYIDITGSFGLGVDSAATPTPSLVAVGPQNTVNTSVDGWVYAAIAGSTVLGGLLGVSVELIVLNSLLDGVKNSFTTNAVPRIIEGVVAQLDTEFKAVNPVAGGKEQSVQVGPESMVADLIEVTFCPANPDATHVATSGGVNVPTATRRRSKRR
jgi:hypothetical protein